MSVKIEHAEQADADQGTRVEDIERKLRAAGAQRTLYSAVLAGKLGMHPTDLECLFIITLGTNVTPGLLAQETGLTSGAVTGVVNRLERAGYIQRKLDVNDRRRVFLEPEMERIEEIRAINRRANKPWLEELARYSEAELELLLDFADRNYHAAVNATVALRSEPDPGRPRKA